MNLRRTAAAQSTFLALVLAAPLAADGPVVRDQSNLRTDAISSISSQVLAIDFSVGSATRLTGAQVFLADGVNNNNGQLDNWSGTLGWAVYTDAAGEPGTEIESGRAIGIVARDTGLTVFDDDALAVSFDLEPPVRLAPGNYWFLLHETAWEAPYDSSQLYSLYSASTYGSAYLRSADLAEPFTWQALSSYDLGWILYGESAAWDQGGVIDGANGHRITTDVRANDFVVLSESSASAFDVWLSDDTVNDNGVVDDFGGTLGWAIYENGSNVPGAMVAHGEDSSPLLIDTGLQDAVNSDIVRARVRFGRSIPLPAGSYWLALQEGAWGSASDGTYVYWDFATSNIGIGTVGASDEQNPVDWNIAPATDTAFVLFEDRIFASGFDSGSACAWSGGDGPCP